MNYLSMCFFKIRRGIGTKYFIYKLFRGFSLTPNEIESIAQRYKDATRDGAKDLFDKLYLANVPILIFSAGLGDSVKAMLKYFNMLLPNVKVYRNHLNCINFNN